MRFTGPRISRYGTMASIVATIRVWNFPSCVADPGKRSPGVSHRSMDADDADG
jgi:hypothetical protein